MKKMQKRLGHVKSIDRENMTVTAHVSTFQWDRMDERFEKGAWNLQDYMKNPVVLWGHNSFDLPIGKAVSVSEDEQGLVATTMFDKANEKSMEVFGLFERGFLNAFSVGFIPKRWRFESIEGSEKKGLIFEKADLLEYSAVSIPANPGAIVSREFVEVVSKAFGNPEGGTGLPFRPADSSSADKGSFVVTPMEFKIDKFVPEELPQVTEDIGKSLKYLLDIAKARKDKKFDNNTLILLSQSITVFRDIIDENSEHVTRDDFQALKGVVGDLSEVVKNIFPDVTEEVRRIMVQVDRAIKTVAE